MTHMIQEYKKIYKNIHIIELDILFKQNHIYIYIYSYTI